MYVDKFTFEIERERSVVLTEQPKQPVKRHQCLFLFSTVCKLILYRYLSIS